MSGELLQDHWSSGFCALIDWSISFWGRGLFNRHTKVAILDTFIYGTSVFFKDYDNANGIYYHYLGYS